MISRRGSAFLAAALLALLLAGYALNLLLLVGAVAFFGAVAGEIVYFDIVAARRVAIQFSVVRAEGGRYVSPGAIAEVEFTITYEGLAPLFAEVRELLPASLPLTSGDPSWTGWWFPNQSATIRYAVRAGDRGSHLVGPVAVTVRSSHGLAWRQVTLPHTEEPVRVVPPAPIEHSYRIGPGLFTRMQGRMALRHRGYGTEFRSLRPYQLSDDIRHVAWKRSRGSQWYVREFEQESRQDFVLMLDVSPAMLAGIPGANALDRAIEAGSLVIAAVARNGEDRVGLLTHTDRPRQYFRPARGEYHFRRLAENLAYLKSEPGPFDLAAALEVLTRRLTTNTHVLAFTALDGPLEQIPAAHRRFRARGHHLYLFPPNRAAFYPPLPDDQPGTVALRWAEAEERGRLGRRIAEMRGEGIPVFPYDRRGASGPVLSAYSQLRAWGQA